MVFEQIYTAEFLRKRPAAGFLLGISYTLFGIFLALIIFKEDPALIALGITSIVLMPSLQQLTTITEKTTAKLKDFKSYLLESMTYTKVYVYIFFGIFFTFALLAVFLPKLAASHIFAQQLAVIQGKATTFSWALFWDLFTWNLNVIALCFILSLIAGNGAIIFIAWNASVWGTVFGTLAKTAALASQGNPLIIFILVLLSVFPHTFLEGLSYMTATVSGTVLSEGITKEKLRSPHMKKILIYNALLLLIAIGILAFGMLVETYVLKNFTTYRAIIEIAFPR